MGCGLQDFSVSPSPLETNLGFELGWVLGVWGQGLTIVLLQIGSLLNTMIIYMGVTETESPTFLFILENVRSIQILCSTLLPALIGK